MDIPTPKSPFGALRRPRTVTLEQGRLRWEPPLGASRVAPNGMLDKFRDLAGATDGEVLRFAKRYGVLGLCRHRLPYTHAPAVILNRSPLEPSRKGCRPRQVEKLADWRWYARGFQAALNAVAQLENDKLPLEADWKALQGSVMGWSEDFALPKRATKLTLAQVRLWLTRVLNGLLRLGGVVLAVQPDNGADWRAAWHCGPVIAQTRIHVGGRVWLPVEMASETSAYDVNTFGHLAIQLVTNIARTDGLALCSACGQAFAISQRRRSPTRRAYCRRCGRTAALRDAKRAYRSRLREKAQ